MSKFAVRFERLVCVTGVALCVAGAALAQEAGVVPPPNPDMGRKITTRAPVQAGQRPARTVARTTGAGAEMPSAAGAARAPMTPEQRAAAMERRKQALERMGGFVARPATGPVLNVLNLQERAEQSVADEALAEFSRVTSLPYVLERVTAEADVVAQVAAAAKADTNKVAFVLGLVDSSTLPMILVAPDARWGIVNVAELLEGMDGDGAEELVRTRISKVVWRGATWVMGGGTSGLKSAMSPAYSLAEVDGLGSATGPDLLNRVLDVARARGMQRQGRATYRQACEEGWAPAPENEVQRKVAEEVAAEKGKKKAELLQAP